MITLTSQPYDTSFSRNQVLYKFLATDDNGNAYGHHNVRSELRGTGFLPILENDTIEVRWTDAGGILQTVEFTAKDAPALDTEIPTNLTSGINTYTDLYNGIAAVMNAHSLAGAFINFSQKFNGSSNSLWGELATEEEGWALTFNQGLTNLHELYTYEAGSSYPDNYKMLIDVVFKDGDDYAVISSHEIREQADGVFAIDISDILHKHFATLRPEMPLPAFTDDEMQTHDIIKEYYINYRESYDDIASAAWAVSDTKRIFFGGISQSLFTQHNFFNEIDNTNSFLTWYPDYKNVSTDQPEWLAWYNYTGATKNIMLACMRKDADCNENNTSIFEAAPLEVAAGEVVLIPAGVTQLDILTTMAAAAEYTIQVIDADDWAVHTTTAYSPERHYYIDKDYYLSARYIQYMNGFNCPETLRCVGEFSDELKVDRKIRLKVRDTDYTSSSVDISQFDQSFNNYFSYRSGFVSKSEVDALQELMIYAKLWEVNDQGYIRLNIDTDTMQITQTRRYLNTLEFVATPAMEAKNYSNNNILALTDTSGWAIHDGGFWVTVFGEAWQIS